PYLPQPGAEVGGPIADNRTRPAPSTRYTPTDKRWADLQPFQVDANDLIKQRVFTNRAGTEATPFDILRTKVLLQMSQNGWKRLAITSPLPNTGKSTTACNLALSLARQPNLRSILLDLDLGGPSIFEFFNATPPHSIGKMLMGEVDFAQQALRIGDNLACSMAQDAEPDPTRLLLSDKTAEVINQIEADYQPDLMIFDLPSVLVNDETRAFLRNVDCALIIVRAEQTKYHQFDICEREVAEQTNVLGVVLNAAKKGAHSN
ncbi:MAG: CpsD/CapB family tyrosine-protein kinase, partial [Pseudomonadota bacterium]